MKNQQRKGVRAIAWMCTLVYFTSYLLRKNLGVMLVKVCLDMDVTESAFAIVLTGLTIAYGGGQIVSGMLGDKIPPRYMIFIGLSVATLANFSVYFTSSIPMMTVLWCINGFANSMIWGPMVKLFAECLNDKEYNFSMMRVMWGSYSATVALRIICPTLLFFINWRGVMLVIAGFAAIVTALYMLTYDRVFKSSESGNDAAEGANGQVAHASAPAVEPLPKSVWVPTILLILGIIMHGMLREGVDVYMPSFLCDTFGMSEENAIFSTVILSVFAVLSLTLFGYLHRRFFKNEIMCGAVSFGVATAAAVVLYIINSAGGSVVASMILMAIIIACMSGANLMLIATAPKRYARSGKVSTFTGVLDAAAYVGAAISTYGFAVIAEGKGWNFTILTWVFIAAAGLVFSLVAAPLWRKFRQTYADK